jgi:hypothetical protein
MILEGFTYFTGQQLGAPAFSTAFMLVASITAFAAIPFLRLAPDAGSSVSGHAMRRPGKGQAVSE